MSSPDCLYCCSRLSVRAAGTALEPQVNNGGGAHARYNPGDMRDRECRKRLTEAKLEDKVEVYGHICSRFQPVFRHYFLETSRSSGEWFNKRLAYTRSAACASIVGYVVGLGDRHTQNILIDETTAELVHIDLGIAFDMGKSLPTPETVPFRLTRDLVDGMGISGVEGVFRSCCEQTTSVLRDNRDTLETILDVFIHDPLYAWTLTNARVMRVQGDAEAARNGGDVTAAAVGAAADGVAVGREGGAQSGTGLGQLGASSKSQAERALMRVQNKLRGEEQRVTLSVSGQVNFLIQQARDPERLAKLFPGWRSWV